jgi:hypothetical protein
MITALLVFVLFAQGFAVYAQVPDDPNLVEEDNPLIEITFSEMGLTSPQSLPGPVSEISLRFNFPLEWEITPGTMQLSLNIAAYFSNLMPSEEQEIITGLTGGNLSISLNGTPVLLETLQESGEATFEVNLDTDLLKEVSRSDANELIIRWDGSAACRMNLLSNITILPSSKMTLAYEPVSPSFTLNDYPVPFMVRNSLQPGLITLLLPEDATSAELRAALITSAGLGRLFAGKQHIRLLTVADYQAEGNQAKAILLFAEGTRLADDAIKALGYTNGMTVQAGEGTLQIFTHGNAGYGLLITGDADGIVKAAQVLSTGQLIAAGDGSTMRVNAVNVQPAVLGIETLTLQDLGAGELLLSPGSGYARSLDFYIPAGDEARPDASFDLILSHSQQLDYLRSGLTVKLNSYPIATLRLTDQTSNQVLFRLILPTNLIHPGRNTLTFAANLNTRDFCSEMTESTVWLKVSANSVLHLPLEKAESSALSNKKFSDFPDIFLSGRSLDNVMFLLSLDDAGSWTAAGDLAFHLGSVLVDRNPIQLQVSVIEDLEEPVSPENNLIIVGKPQNYPELVGEELFPSMAFTEDNLLSDQSNLSMVSIPSDADASVGYLAIRGYPGAAQRVSLAVLGNSPLGLGYAVKSLGNPVLGDNNFAVAMGDGLQASWFDESIARGELQVKASEDDPIVVDSNAAYQFRLRLMSWVVPVMAALLLIMILIILLEIRKNKRRMD